MAENPVSSTVVFSHAVAAEPESEPEGGEQPSATSVTEEPAGTASSDSFNQDGSSDGSSENATPLPVLSVESQSDPVEKTESSTALGDIGAGTDL